MDTRLLAELFLRQGDRGVSSLVPNAPGSGKRANQRKQAD
jgi:hypothetical protein